MLVFLFLFFQGLEADFISFIKLYTQFKGGVAWTGRFLSSGLHWSRTGAVYSNTF